MTGPRSLEVAVRSNAMVLNAPQAASLDDMGEFCREAVESCNMKNWPDRGEADRRGKQVARPCFAASAKRHGLDLFDQLLRGKRPPVNENLAGELLGPRAAALQPGKQPHLELGLDAADLLLAEAALGGAEELVAQHAREARAARSGPQAA